MNSLSFKTQFGWISAFEEKNKIIKVSFGKHRNKSISKNLIKFRNYFRNFSNGKDTKISFIFHAKGNLVQKKVWNELSRIRIGHTKSYGEIAKKFNLSPRHVGKICAQNKIILLIPCHRVIRSDGNLGGFSAIGGTKLKEKLLNFEKNF